ncbi:hypothetical protein C8R45DRAFT_1097566 [Mycena sanguinolenta]|nr:hypothetical protein C8R45DRAFT_1097566 [Mycena sanguinolenta]
MSKISVLAFARNALHARHITAATRSAVLEVGPQAIQSSSRIRLCGPHAPLSSENLANRRAGNFVARGHGYNHPPVFSQASGAELPHSSMSAVSTARFPGSDLLRRFIVSIDQPIGAEFPHSIIPIATPKFPRSAFPGRLFVSAVPLPLHLRGVGNMSSSFHPDPATIAHLLQGSSLTLAQIDQWFSSITDEELGEILEVMGLEELARRMPPVLSKLMLAAECNINCGSASPIPSQTSHVSTASTISETDSDRTFHRVFDAIEDVLAQLDVIDLDDTPTLPSSSPEPPHTPSKPQVAKSTPLKPTPTPARYAMNSPAKSGYVATWFEVRTLTQGVPGVSVRSVVCTRRTREGGARAYAVFYGKEVGVFEDWNNAAKSTTGHLAIHAGFPSLSSATAALEYAREKGWTGDSAPPANCPQTPLPIPSSYEDNPLNSRSTTNGWYVVCRGIAPGVYRSWLEYSLNTTGLKGNLYNMFQTRAEAEDTFLEAWNTKYVRFLSR